MSQNEQSPEEIQTRFDKMAEEMPCLIECLESILGEIDKSEREKCFCPGCNFRRVVAGLFGRQASGKERAALVEVFPRTHHIEEAFSELLAAIERISKYEHPSDNDLPMLEQNILGSLGTLRVIAEEIEHNYQRMSTQPKAVVHFKNQPPPPPEVGSRMEIWGLMGTIESLDGNSMLVRFERPGLPQLGQQ